MIVGEYEKIANQIHALGVEINEKRRALLNLVDGKIATERSGRRFVIDRVKVHQVGSGFEVYLDGRVMKPDGVVSYLNRATVPMRSLTITEGKTT